MREGPELRDYFTESLEDWVSPFNSNTGVRETGVQDTVVSRLCPATSRLQS